MGSRAKSHNRLEFEPVLPPSVEFGLENEPRLEVRVVCNFGEAAAAKVSVY